MEVASLVSACRQLSRSTNADITRGCVTPSVIHNWKEQSGDDMDLVDGYEDLPAEFQEKVTRAFQQGHVDDEDWNGVSCHQVCTSESD